MGKIIALRAGADQQKDKTAGALDVSRASAANFPELADRIEKAMDQIAARPPREQRLILGTLGRHFQAMEKVLALLQEQNHSLYRPTLESYLTMQLKTLTGVLARNNILQVYCTM